MKTPEENRNIEIGQNSINTLNSIRKWAMFLAIVGFIFLGMMLIFGLLAGTFMSLFKSTEIGTGFPEAFVFILILVIALIFFFPILFLFRFSKHTANAVHSLNREELHKAFRNLKASLIYFGIMIIIVLSIYFAGLIIAGTSMSFLKGIG